MKKTKKNPTDELYSSMEIAFEHFNQQLFGSKLPPVIFTTQRQIGVMGHFSADRWVTKGGKKCHEISINLAYVGRASIIELCQTLVHEQNHLFQYCYGKPGRSGYHNSQWSNKMESMGLMPSHTGIPGGKKTGERMADYPIRGGKFVKACSLLVTEKEYSLPWIDRFSEPVQTILPEELEYYSEALSDIEEVAQDRLTTKFEDIFSEDVFVKSETARKKVKTKYHCYSCEYSVWGKSELNIGCFDCGDQLVEFISE